MLKKLASKTLIGLSVSAVLTASAMAKDVVVDVYYTASAAARSFDIKTEIKNMVAASNANYAKNNLDINLVLAWDGDNQTSTDYVASWNNIQSLYKNSQIRNWRDEYKADFVVVIGSAQSTWQGTTCGIAGSIYGMADVFPDHNAYDSYAYNITANNCGDTTLTFMHELGHNMGLGHSVRQGAEGGVYTWGVGYGVDNQFATIMAYPQEFNTTNQLSYFSNPGFTLSGEPIGVNNVADAQRALELVTDQIAAFR
ncbi:reprolysin-like metallopeptidase [Thalassomonas actiniarum]|uniref:Peptidase M10 metallopeptidase domain-containing protein n=1 Tax=Thalassomonas actiniarum TaxID=485447 RepID=A0AAE9YNH9_9GAMM|nr:zinc-dependent metalloprotease family protein [Thalassomonas actiniarum]WDD98270.1 hypothetical protein SG35_023820 [Thalassomonas actiniarum]